MKQIESFFFFLIKDQKIINFFSNPQLKETLSQICVSSNDHQLELILEFSNALQAYNFSIEEKAGTKFFEGFSKKLKLLTNSQSIDKSYITMSIILKHFLISFNRFKKLLNSKINNNDQSSTTLQDGREENGEMEVEVMEVGPHQKMVEINLSISDQEQVLLDNFEVLMSKYQEAQDELSAYNLKELLDFFNEKKQRYESSYITVKAFKTIFKLLNKKDVDSDFLFNDIAQIFCGLPLYLLSFKARALLISEYTKSKFPKNGIAGAVSSCFLHQLEYMKMLNDLNLNAYSRKQEKIDVEEFMEIETDEVKMMNVNLYEGVQNMSIISLFNPKPLKISSKTLRIVEEDHITVYPNFKIPELAYQQGFTLGDFIRQGIYTLYTKSDYQLIYINKIDKNNLGFMAIEDLSLKMMKNQPEIEIHMVSKKLFEKKESMNIIFFEISQNRFVHKFIDPKNSVATMGSIAKQILTKFKIWTKVNKEVRVKFKDQEFQMMTLFKNRVFRKTGKLNYILSQDTPLGMTKAPILRLRMPDYILNPVQEEEEEEKTCVENDAESEKEEEEEKPKNKRKKRQKRKKRAVKKKVNTKYTPLIASSLSPIMVVNEQQEILHGKISIQSILDCYLKDEALSSNSQFLKISNSNILVVRIDCEDIGAAIQNKISLHGSTSYSLVGVLMVDKSGAKTHFNFDSSKSLFVSSNLSEQLQLEELSRQAPCVFYYKKEG